MKQLSDTKVDLERDKDVTEQQTISLKIFYCSIICVALFFIIIIFAIYYYLSHKYVVTNIINDELL